jgi:16S rRNA (uracil1498-N3)-methyltransferase
MHRFFLSPERCAGDQIILPDNVARQTRVVLRLRPGERIMVLDGQGLEIEVELSEVSQACVAGRVLARRPAAGEARTSLVLCQGLLKADLFEWVLQKGTELGVSAFVPMQCQRSQPGLEAPSPARLERWRAIIREAAEQCRRGLVPALRPVQTFSQVLAALPVEALAVVLWEEAREPSLRAFLRNALARQADTSARPLYLLVGPRDGLTAEEAHLAQDHGAQVVTLGPRILRAETAALAAATIMLYECADLE